MASHRNFLGLVQRYVTGFFSHHRPQLPTTQHRRTHPNPGVYPAYTTPPANKDQGFLGPVFSYTNPKVPVSSVRSVYTNLTLPYMRHPRALGHGGGPGSYILVRSAIYIFRITATLVCGWCRGRHVRRQGWGTHPAINYAAFF